jgi:glycosyltransferase involved in cell wall biosynthesis
MNIHQEPFFHILGYDTEHTGYGIHTKEFLNVLRKHKKDFLFTDITHLKTYADREKLKTKLSQKQNVYNIAINYGSECYTTVKDYDGLKIGWTVWESTIIPDNWKDELNKLDQVWIPSKWGKNILVENGVDIDKIKVVPEGVNTEVFKRLERRPENNITKLKGFKFLNIGKYEGRKNTDLLIRAFDEEFNKEENVFLFLQAYNAFIPNFNLNQIIDSMNLKNREKIYVISPIKNHNDLSVIYNSCDCFVYPTRAEGWGLPLIEALSCGMNSIACNNGGQSEYLYNPEQQIYIDLNYTMIDITRKDFGNFMFHTNNTNNNMGQWAEIEMNELKTKMRYAFKNKNNNNNSINTVAMKHIHQYWSWDKLLENENFTCTRSSITHSSNIPKFFYQSWCRKDNPDSKIPSEILNKTLKYMPSGFTYKCFTLNDIRDYLKTNWGNNVLDLFESYKYIPHKIDLWRYCILYDTGGIYMDADCVLSTDISILMNNDAVFVTNNRGVKDIFNGFIITIEKNPIIKNIIDFMVKVKTDLEYDYYYNCKELYNIINNYIELSLGKHNYQINKLGVNGKMCILFDKQLNDGRFYPFYNEIPLLSETNSLYPYP